MIDGIKVEGQTLRMTVRAMMALEQAHSCSIDEVMSRMSKSPSVRLMLSVLSECQHDGAGGTLEEAGQLADQIGYVATNALLGQLVTAAFAVPEGMALEEEAPAEGAPVEGATKN